MKALAFTGFYHKGSESPGTKVARRRTLALHGMPWRLMISGAKDGISYSLILLEVVNQYRSSASDSPLEKLKAALRGLPTEQSRGPGEPAAKRLKKDILSLPAPT